MRILVVFKRETLTKKTEIMKTLVFENGETLTRETFNPAALEIGKYTPAHLKGMSFEMRDATNLEVKNEASRIDGIREEYAQITETNDMISAENQRVANLGKPKGGYPGMDKRGNVR